MPEPIESKIKFPPLAGGSNEYEFGADGPEVVRRAQDLLEIAARIKIHAATDGAEAVTLTQLNKAIAALDRLKQNTLSIAPDSAPYLHLSDRSVLSYSPIVFRRVIEEPDSLSLEAFILEGKNDLSQGEVLVLNRTFPREVWLHKGGQTQTPDDFVPLAKEVTVEFIRAAIDSGGGLAYDRATGEIKARPDDLTIEVDRADRLTVKPGAIGLDRLAPNLAEKLANLNTISQSLQALRAEVERLQPDRPMTSPGVIKIEFDRAPETIETPLIQSGQWIDRVVVRVLEPFASGAEITIGTRSAITKYLTPDRVDLQRSDSYESTDLHQVEADHSAIVSLTGGSDRGRGLLMIHYY